jgi:hypothetical protein
MAPNSFGLLDLFLSLLRFLCGLLILGLGISAFSSWAALPLPWRAPRTGWAAPGKPWRLAPLRRLLSFGWFGYHGSLLLLSVEMALAGP